MVAGEFISGQDFADDSMNLGWDGRVYEIDPRERRVVRKIDSGIRFTNGIAFDAHNRLYSNASFTGEVYRYNVSVAERLAAKTSAMCCSLMTGPCSGVRTA